MVVNEVLDDVPVWVSSKVSTYWPINAQESTFVT